MQGSKLTLNLITYFRMPFNMSTTAGYSVTLFTEISGGLICLVIYCAMILNFIGIFWYFEACTMDIKYSFNIIKQMVKISKGTDISYPLKKNLQYIIDFHSISTG